MKWSAFLLVLLALQRRLYRCACEPLWNDVCTQEDTIGLPFCDTALDIVRRVDDLLQRIPTTSQTQMMGSYSTGYDPLHIPAYNWWSEGAHGMMQKSCYPTKKDNRTACPTCFPCPSTMASSFNDTLFLLMSSAIGREGRAVSNIRDHVTDMGDGLTYWSPVVNMQRDPRWGRNQEVPGEDPLLTSRYAVQYVKGLQQKRIDDATSTQPMQLAACCKHFVANSLEKWKNYSRHEFDAVVSEEDLREYYYPPFVACVKEAGVAGIMCSYNALNGIPSCVNEPLLKDYLRDGLGFDGYVTSDCGAVYDVADYHHYTKDHVVSAALAVNASTNVNCGHAYQYFLNYALRLGMVTPEVISSNYRSLLTVQMKLGLFDQPKSKNPYAKLGADDIDTVEHQQLALEAAEQGIVLLQNKATGNTPVLPLQRNQRIAVVGPHSNATTAFKSNYFFRRCPPLGGVNDGDSCILTPFAAISQANEGGTTVSARGCDVHGKEDIAHAREVAASADAIVMMVGLDRSQEDEGLDRVETTLPGYQVELVHAMLELKNPRTVLVLVNGGSISLGPRLLKTQAIVQAGYGGQSASQALANVLFGVYNPSGRLAATMYPPEFVQQVPMTDMNLRTGIGRTYMFYRGEAEFSFGDGLSFSEWTVEYEYSYDPVPQEGDGGKISLAATLTNKGPLAGRQSLLLFAISSKELHTRKANHQARQRLIDYAGTVQILNVGQAETLEFELGASSLAHGYDLVVLEPNGVRTKLGSWKDLILNAKFSSTTTHLSPKA